MATTALRMGLRASHPSLLNIRPRLAAPLVAHPRRTANPHSTPLRPHRAPRAVVAALVTPTPASVTTAAASLVSLVQGSIDPGVLAATASASYKLFLVCIAVGWLLKTNRIPNATASVLSQVSFQLLIPCMLFSKVAATLAASPDPSFLLGMAAAAVGQIAIGALWGTLLAPLVDGRGLKGLTVLGQQPFSPGGAPAAAIANATAAATGLPQAAAALLPRPAPTPPGLRELIIASCSFGNSFTLPAVFFLSLLPGIVADQAIAYSGLFLLAWSPCLWSFGLTLIETGFLRGQAAAAAKQQQQQQMRPEFALASSSTGESGGYSSDTIDLDAASPEPTLPPRPPPSWLPILKRFFGRALNPPVLAILVGMVVGLSPPGQQLFLALAQGSSAAAPASPLPFELSLLWSGLRGCYEVIQMLAAGTLAMQTLVLAASLLQSAGGASGDGSNGGASSSTEPRRGTLRAIVAALAPSDATEARALAVLSLVRFLLVPVSAILAWRWAVAAGLVGSLAADPLFLFVIAVQSVMPSAQNLIIVLQLSDVTRPAAPAYARLLLKLYAYAVLPVTLWVTAFASRLNIPLIH